MSRSLPVTNLSLLLNAHNPLCQPHTHLSHTCAPAPLVDPLVFCSSPLSPRVVYHKWAQSCVVSVVYRFDKTDRRRRHVVRIYFSIFHPVISLRVPLSRIYSNFLFSQTFFFGFFFGNFFNQFNSFPQFWFLHIFKSVNFLVKYHSYREKTLTQLSTVLTEGDMFPRLFFVHTCAFF